MIKLKIKEFLNKWRFTDFRKWSTGGDVAKLLGVSGATLSKIENEKMLPGLETYFTMCIMSELDPCEFMEGVVVAQNRAKAHNEKKRKDRQYRYEMSALRNSRR
jgi:DNA-binding XRE family transcriptional regulator